MMTTTAAAVAAWNYAPKRLLPLLHAFHLQSRQNAVAAGVDVMVDVCIMPHQCYLAGDRHKC